MAAHETLYGFTSDKRKERVYPSSAKALISGVIPTSLGRYAVSDEYIGNMSKGLSFPNVPTDVNSGFLVRVESGPTAELITPDGRKYRAGNWNGLTDGRWKQEAGQILVISGSVSISANSSKVIDLSAKGLDDQKYMAISLMQSFTNDGSWTHNIIKKGANENEWFSFPFLISGDSLAVYNDNSYTSTVYYKAVFMRA